MSREAEQLRRRNRELAILNEVAGALNESVDLARALEVALARVSELLKLETGWVWLLHEETGESYLAASRNLPPGLADHPERMEAQQCWCLDAFRQGALQETKSISVIACSRLASLDEPGSGGLHYHASVPLMAGERRLGLLNVAGADGEELSAEDLRLLHTVGDLLGIAVERTRLYEDSASIGAAEERYRLAREIHDTLGQSLTAVLLRLESLDAVLESATEVPDAARVLTRETLDLTRDNLEEARRAVLDLRAAELEGHTLADALEALGAATSTADIVVGVEATGNRPLPMRVEAGLYRVAQESVRNAIDHARPAHIRVHLLSTPESVTLSVVDDGIGFEPGGTASEHWGLVGLNERVRLLGGEFRVGSAPGRGTRIEVVVPLSPEMGR